MSAATDDPTKELMMESVWPAKAENLQLIRTCILDILRERGVCEKDLSQIEISLDEACCNAVKHAYSSGKGDIRPIWELGGEPAIRVVLRLNDEQVHIEVIDAGVGNSGGAHRGISDLDDYLKLQPPHGLGFYIIGKCMDRFDLSYPTDSGTRLSMTKYIGRVA
jgi:serine/threonine-protein kinase RsbW